MPSRQPGTSSSKSSTSASGYKSFPSPKPFSKPPESHRSSAARKLSPDEQARHEEVESVWKAMKMKNGNPETIILAVVKQEHKQQLLTRAKDSNTEIWSTIVVTTPENLQAQINSYVNKKFKTLHLLVSSFINRITYDVAKVVKEVYVTPCGSHFTGRPDMLRIGSSSTYCGVKTYAWDHRPSGELRTGGYRIIHGEGCHFEISDDIDEARSLLTEPNWAPPVPDEDMRALKDQFADFQANFMRESPGSNTRRGRPVSPVDGRSPSPDTDETGTWFNKWKALLAAVLATGAGFAGIGGAIWCSAGGIFIKGPSGFSMAAGYFNIAAIGGACATGAAAAFAAGAIVYLIPWDVVFRYVGQTLRKIWDYVRDVVDWIWEKIKGMASTVASVATAPLSYMQGPARSSAYPY